MRICICILALFLSACASHPGTRVAVQSSNPFWIDEILGQEEAEPQRIWGQLSYPETGVQPGTGLPAIVLVHSAQGRDAQMWMYADRFNAMGIATLTLDSFTQRGIQKIERDQTAVTEASMISDAFAALEMLSNDPRIDPARIGIFGISKGGAPTIYSSLERVAEALAPEGPRFALHLAYYPWCGMRFLEPTTTGAPILIQSGGRDLITPAEVCRDLLTEMRAHDPSIQAEMIVHPEARHAFDHPYLAHLPAVPTRYLAPHRCLIRERRPGLFIEESRDTELFASNLSSALEACSRAGFLAGGHPASAAAAWENTERFLRRHLLSSTETARAIASANAGRN